MQALVRRNVQNDDSSQLGTMATANSIRLMAANNQIVIAPSNGNSFSITAAAPTADRVYTIPDGGASDTLALQHASENLYNKTILNTQFPSYGCTVESSLAGDAGYRYYLYADGSHHYGSGTASNPDTRISRTAAATISIDDAGTGPGTLIVDNIYPTQTNGNLNLYPNGTGTVYVQSNGLMIANSSLTNYTPSALDAYEYTTLSVIFDGPFVQTVNVSVVRVGRMCTVTFPVIQATSTSSARLSSVLPLASPFIPIVAVQSPCRVYAGGGISTSPGLFYVDTLGNMTFAADLTNATFSATGTAGPFPFSISWVTYY